jgi:DNA replication protein DnaC
MSANRSFEDIFLSLQNLAELREQEESDTLPQNQTQPCFCGKNEYSTHHEDPSEESETDEIEESEPSEPIYIEHTLRGLRYAVCPACNPRLHCALCEGTGHRVLSKVHIFETDDGEVVEHVTEEISPNSCSCTHTERLVVLLNNAEIPSKYMEAEMSSFKDDHLNENQSKKLNENINKIHKFCTQVASNALGDRPVNQKYFITLFGPVGSGKTLLAAAALKMVIVNYGFAGRFVDFQFLLNQIKAEYEQKRSGESLLRQLREVDILVIDELGKGRNENEWQLEKLDDLINSRYNSRKITILTTNYLPQNYKYEDKEIPRTMNKEVNDFWREGKSSASQGNIPVHESFWTQTLLERVGSRMYERIYEVSEFIDFMGMPSYRKFLGKGFLDLYSSKK